MQVDVIFYRCGECPPAFVLCPECDKKAHIDQPTHDRQVINPDSTAIPLLPGQYVNEDGNIYHSRELLI